MKELSQLLKSEREHMKLKMGERKCNKNEIVITRTFGESTKISPNLSISQIPLVVACLKSSKGSDSGISMPLMNKEHFSLRE